MEEQFREVPIGMLAESPLNTRKYFDAVALAELIESVKRKSVLVPLLVRPNWSGAPKLEVLAGARRLRAATAAGLAELPVRVIEATDDEALEIIVLENLQHEDVHELEEADGYRALLGRPGYDVAAIAAKVSKSESYVYQRLKLTELIEDAKAAFLDGKITTGHAILIARLQERDQKDAFKHAFRDDWDFDDDDEPGGKRKKIAVSVRDLSSWIDDNIHLALVDAPFDKSECETCPKRTGFAPALFPEIKNKDTCTDRRCFAAKKKDFLAAAKERATKNGVAPVELSADWRGGKGVLGSYDYTKADKKCPHTQKGIIVSSEYDPKKLGKVIPICAEPACKVHRKNQTSLSVNSPAAKEQRAREHEKEAIEETLRRRLAKASFEAAPAKLTRAALERIAQILSDYAINDDYYGGRAVVEGCGLATATEGGDVDDANTPKWIAAASDRELVQLLCVLGATTEPMYGSGRDRVKIEKLAAEYGVDVAKIRAEVKAEAKAAAKEKAKLAAAAKKGGKAASPPIPDGEHACENCGCVESFACPGGCAWDPMYLAQGRYICTTPACLKAAKRPASKSKSQPAPRGQKKRKKAGASA